MIQNFGAQHTPNSIRIDMHVKNLQNSMISDDEAYLKNQNSKHMIPVSSKESIL
jgi:hypothetical protein